jgi:hypothetical protein
MKLRKLLLTLFFTVALSSCSSAAEKSEVQLTTPRKGAQQAMKTYYMGRFAIDVPAEFKLVMQNQKFRYAEITEIDWPVSLPRENARNQIWDARISEINKLKCPAEINKPIIKSIDIKTTGGWGKGVLYFGNYMSSKDGYWEVLVDVGPVGLWIKLDGLTEYENEMLVDIKEIAHAYKYYGPETHPVSPESRGFHLQMGVIYLPYLEQENSYARFEGPLGTVIRVEMAETHKVDDAGVMDRLAASLAMNFAPGVNVDKIRAGKRTVAGLAGQEIITRLSDVNGKELFFAWDYQGEENSGDHPEIMIGSECLDRNLNQMLKAWDMMLLSFHSISN